MCTAYYIIIFIHVTKSFITIHTYHTLVHYTKSINFKLNGSFCRLISVIYWVQEIFFVAVFYFKANVCIIIFLYTCRLKYAGYHWLFWMWNNDLFPRSNYIYSHWYWFLFMIHKLRFYFVSYDFIPNYTRKTCLVDCTNIYDFIMFNLSALCFLRKWKKFRNLTDVIHVHVISYI